VVGPTGSGTYLTITAPAILRWSVAIVVPAAAALIYRRRRALEAYGVDILQARRWRSLGLSPEEAQDHLGLGPEFVSSWLAAGFTVEEMVELIRHKIFVDEAVAWRRAACQWTWRRSGAGIGCHPTTFTCGAPAGSAPILPTYASPLASHRKKPHWPTSAASTLRSPLHARRRSDTSRPDAPAGWVGRYPPRYLPPDPLLSWDDDEDGPKVEWWIDPEHRSEEVSLPPR
jgi:hypothetical protein